MRRAWAVVLALAGVVVVAGIAASATGDTQQVVVIDDFEDGDTTVERLQWSGWEDGDNVFDTTTNAIAGSHSGRYQPGSNDNDQAVNVTRSSKTTRWLNFSASVDGESGTSVVHEFRVFSGSTQLLRIEYDENSTDQFGDLEVVGSSTTKVGEWTEDATGVQEWAIDFDVGNNEADVYLNGTDQGTFTLATACCPIGWDRFEIETETAARTVDDTTIRVDDVGGDMTVTDPTVDNTSASPTGGLQQADQTLEINISDPDFGDPEDDELTVEFYKDGSLIDTQTITSNGTVSTTTRFDIGGDHTWHVNATDDYGGWTRSQNFTVTTPSNLTIYNETSPTQVIDKTTNVTLRFFGEDEVFTREAENGTINMTGLPLDQTFVVRVSHPDFYTTTEIIENVFENQRIYLLNTSFAANQVRFTLDDRSGQFPRDETRLFVKKPITRNGSTTFETVLSDEFGATGITKELQTDERYRLIIENAEGDTRNVGPYTTSVDETVQLTPGVASIGLDPDPDTYEWDAEFQNDTGTYGAVVFEYADPTESTEDMRVVIHEKGNESNEFVNTTDAGPLGNLTVTYMLQNADERNVTFAVDFSATRNGESISGTEFVGVRGPEIGPELPDWAQEALAFVTLLLLGAAFTARDYEIGAVVLPIFAGFFWYMQWLDGVTSGAAIVLALALAGGYQIRQGVTAT